MFSRDGMVSDTRALMIGAVSFAAGASLVMALTPGTSATPTAVPTPTATATPDWITSTPTTRPAAPRTTRPASPVSSFTDGTYLVGVDITPGTYRATGESGKQCYWVRASDASGSMDSIIANDIGEGQAVVTIASTDAAFTSRRCGTWTKAS